MGLNVSILKTSVFGTLYTCPANTVAEIEIVAGAAAASGILSVVSNGVTTEWLTTGSALLRKSFTTTSGSASSDNSFLEDLGGGNYILRPRFVRLTAGDTLSLSLTNRACSFIIYEHPTGNN